MSEYVRLGCGSHCVLLICHVEKRVVLFFPLYVLVRPSIPLLRLINCDALPPVHPDIYPSYEKAQEERHR